MPTYNKLVRDKIPQIIRASGKNPITKILSQGDLVKALKEKLKEECEEFEESETLEELADISEVVIALANILGSNQDELEETMATKRSTNGGFQEGIFLLEVLS